MFTQFVSIFLVLFTWSGVGQRLIDDTEGINYADSLINAKVVDLQNPEDLHNIYQQFNLSADQLEMMRRPLNARTRSGVLPEENNFTDAKQLRIIDIKNKITNAVRTGNNINDFPTYEMTAFPKCVQVNATSWNNEENISLKFTPSLFETARPNMYLDTAFLRLRKVALQNERQFNVASICNTDFSFEQFRLTVSTIHYTKKNKREKRKKICNTRMLNASDSEWIIVDVKKAIYLWEQAEQQTCASRETSEAHLRSLVMVGSLVIDVHDDEGQQLKAGRFFAPPKCEEHSQGSSMENRLALKLIWKKQSEQ